VLILWATAVDELDPGISTVVRGVRTLLGTLTVPARWAVMVLPGLACPSDLLGMCALVVGARRLRHTLASDRRFRCRAGWAFARFLGMDGSACDSVLVCRRLSCSWCSVWLSRLQCPGCSGDNSACPFCAGACYVSSPVKAGFL